MRALVVLGLGCAGDDELVVTPLDAEPAAAVRRFALCEIQLAIALGTLLGHASTVPRSAISYSLQEIGRSRTNWFSVALGLSDLSGHPSTMLSTRRLAPLALVLVLLVIGAAPSGAATSSSARKRQEQVRTKRAKAAAEINALKSSDVQLEKAVAALSAQVRAQDAKLASVRQAVATAEAEVKDSERRIAATESEMTTLQTAVVDRAVTSYMRPQQSAMQSLTQAKNLEDASRRASMLRQVANSDSDVIDQLRATRQDLDVERAKAEAARKVAAERREVAKQQLAAVKKNLADKARVEAALDARIKQVSAEVDALAKEDASLRAVISQESARAAAQRASRSAGGAPTARVSGAGMRWPVNGTVTSEYGARWGRLHAGIDIGAPNGTPIRAAKAGTVILAGSHGGYGLAVVIDHGGGLTTLYAHQSRLGSSSGQDVEAGEVIGYVGSTGNSTGNHLHFETRVDGSPQNPRRYL